MWEQVNKSFPDAIPAHTLESLTLIVNYTYYKKIYNMNLCITLVLLLLTTTSLTLLNL